jgi:hypothetical protein
VKAAVVRSFDRPLEDVNHAVDQVLDGSAPEPQMVFQMTGVGGMNGGHAHLAAHA